MRILIFLIFLFFQTSLFAQYPESLIGTENYVNNKILVVTNRLADSNLRMKNPVFLNRVDTLNTLKYYEVCFSDSAYYLKEVDFERYIIDNKSDFNDWLLFVHGDGKTFIHAASRGLDIQNYHKVNVIVFAWPSREIGKFGGKQFIASLENSFNSQKHFIEIITKINAVKVNNPDYFSDNNFSAMFHSLGNRFLELFANNLSDSSFNKKIFNNIILNAAAVNEKNHKVWIEKINLQENIINNSNMFDRNLNGLRIISKYKFLLGERLSMPLSDSVTYFNFSNSVGGKWPPGRSHTFFVGEMTDKSQNIKQYYFDIFHGIMPDLSKNQYLEKRKDDFGYNVLK